MKIVFAGRRRGDERLHPIKELGRKLPLPENGPDERALLDAIERAANERNPDRPDDAPDETQVDRTEARKPDPE